MPVRLDVDATGEVAVLSGLASDAAVEHLCRSLTTGSVLAAYRALVIDLHDAGPLDLPAQRALHEAGDACLHRRQWLGVVAPGERLATAVRRARQWVATVESGYPRWAGPPLLRDGARLVFDVVIAPAWSVTRRWLAAGPAAAPRLPP